MYFKKCMKAVSLPMNFQVENGSIILHFAQFNIRVVIHVHILKDLYGLSLKLNENIKISLSRPALALRTIYVTKEPPHSGKPQRTRFHSALLRIKGFTYALCNRCSTFSYSPQRRQNQSF